jgi:sigma-B regulation protein RsbU (phosphoserine phosphatase)
MFESENTVRELLISCPHVSSSFFGNDVLSVLSDNSGIISLPVVDDGLPKGLINRSTYMDEISKPFRKELYAKKTCIEFIEPVSLIVSENMSIQDLSFKVAEEGSTALKSGFIITDEQGNYLGVGTGEAVMRKISEMQAKKNRIVMESINYASVIQTSFLRSSREDMRDCMQDYFIHWEPRDKVGGDYYFCKKFADGFFLALIDCTGHGVPGAFMTLIMASFLDHILLEDNRHDPAGALISMNQKVKTALGQISVAPTQQKDEWIDIDSNDSDDGMDTAFCWIDLNAQQITFAGAKTPLLLINPTDRSTTIIEGDKKGVGYVDTPMDFQWTNKTVPLTEGLCAYITTDGIIDQIGGPRNIAFGKQRTLNQLLDHVEKPMPQQCTLFLDTFYEYQGSQRRRDDVCFFGFRA